MFTEGLSAASPLPVAKAVLCEPLLNGQHLGLTEIMSSLGVTVADGNHGGPQSDLTPLLLRSHTHVPFLLFNSMKAEVLTPL